MANRKRRSGDRSESLWGMAGWVFADSLLALAVVFLATQRAAIPLDAAGTSTLSTTEPPRPPVVDGRYVCFRVFVDSAHSDVAGQVRARLAEPDLAGRRAGIVLTFGVADRPGDGIRHALDFNDNVLKLFPQTFRQLDGSQVTSRPFWGGNPEAGHPDGSIEVNIYPIIEGTQRPLSPQNQTDC